MLAVSIVTLATIGLAHAQRSIPVSTLGGPSFVTAEVNDVVNFLMDDFFFNDGVVQTSRDTPCAGLQGGFRSGTTNDTFQRTFSIRITSQEPIFWAMSGQFPNGDLRCQSGVVGTINANQTGFLDFVNLAAATPFVNFTAPTNLSTEAGVGVNAATVSLSFGGPVFPLPLYLNPNATTNGSTIVFPGNITTNGTVIGLPGNFTTNGTVIVFPNGTSSVEPFNGTATVTFGFPNGTTATAVVTPFADIASASTTHSASYVAALVLGVGWALTLIAGAVLVVRNRALERRTRARWVATSMADPAVAPMPSKNNY